MTRNEKVGQLEYIKPSTKLKQFLCCCCLLFASANNFPFILLKDCDASSLKSDLFMWFSAGLWFARRDAKFSASLGYFSMKYIFSLQTDECKHVSSVSLP